MVSFRKTWQWRQQQTEIGTGGVPLLFYLNHYQVEAPRRQCEKRVYV